MAKPVNTILLVLAAVLLVPFASYAAGLGTLTVRSALGQPLDAEIEVVALRPGEELQVRLASRDAYGVAGVDFSPALQGARFAIEKRDGKTVIRVRTTEPVNDPFLSVLVEVQLPSGRLARQYTVLVDPVEFRRAAAPAPAAPPIAAAPAPAVTPPIAVPAPARAPSQAVAATPSPAPAPATPVVAVAPPAPSAAPASIAPVATPTAPPVAVAPMQSALVEPPVPPAAAATAVVATPAVVASPAPAPQPIAAAPAPAQPTIVTAAPVEAPAPAVAPPVTQTVATPTLVPVAPQAPAPPSVTAASTAPMVSTPPAAATEAVAAAAPSVQPVPVSALRQTPQAAAPSVPAVAAAPLVQPEAPAASTAPTQQSADVSDTYRIRRGDTLGAIARKWKPEGVTNEQMLVGLYQTNRPAFIRDNINLIRAGATLFIPGREDVLAISAADAARQVRTHMAAFGRHRDTAVSVGVGSERITQAHREVISRRVGVKRSTRAM
jgi:FimV-like protein